MASKYPNGFKNGLSVRGIPLVQTHPGKVFWVSNSSVQLVNQKNGSNNNDGTFDAPFATLQAGFDASTASRGDVIFIKPGHAESIPDAATLTCNKAGVAVIGLGIGSMRPTFTFTTATTANIPLTAANVTIQNVLFKANFAAVASAFTATGTNTPTDFALEDCEFRDTSSVLNFVALVTGNATANSMDGLRLVRNRISSLGTTAATTAVKILSATDRAVISENFGNWAVVNDTAAMLSTGASNMTNFEFSNNRLQRPNTSSTGGSFISTSATAWTGHAFDNYLYQLDATAGIWIATGTGGAFGFSNNFSPITGAVDKSGLINPAAV